MQFGFVANSGDGNEVGIPKKICVGYKDELLMDILYVCSGYYIREVELAAILLDDIHRVTHFARQNEMLIATHISKKHSRNAV